MPLKIEMTGRGALPVIVCDQCGEPIDDARDGNVQWLADDETSHRRRFAFFSHKGCCAAFEHERGGAAAWFAMELFDALSQLAGPLVGDAGADRAGSGRWRDVG